jgi:acid phosphatase family membrane protein YuiD
MLALIHSYFHNNLLGVPFLALATAIVCKGVFYALRGKWSFRRMLNSGNMPSSHAAFVTALTTAMWLKH